MKKKIENKALFIQRLAAFLIDIVIVSFFATIISFPFIDYDSVKKLDDQSKEIIEKYTNNEIKIDTYFTETKNITYEMAKQEGALTLSMLFISILYFVVYQFKKKGQTVGKKLLKIKVDKYDKDLTINDYIFRAFIIDSIIFDMLIFIFVIFSSSNIYFAGDMVIESIKYILLAVCALMVMFRNDGRGLHDMLAHTIVVKEK